MALEKHFFTQTDPQAHATEIVSWLTENASEYFDSFGVDTETNTDTMPLIVCKIGDVEVLKFAAASVNVSDNVVLAVAALSGDSKTVTSSPYGGVSAYSHFVFATKTDYGVWLCVSVDHNIFITKSNAGTTAVHCRSAFQVNSTKVSTFCYTVDFVSSPTVGSFDISVVMASTMTSLCPIVFTGGTYAPNMFLTPYTQHRGTTGRINVAGTGYLYNGYVALMI